MGGKAENFDERYDKNYLYEYAGRFTQPVDYSILSGSEVSFNFYNKSNELAEIETLAPAAAGPNYPVSPYGYLQSATIAGGDAKIKLFNALNINGEVEMGDTFGYLPKPFDAYTGDFPPKYHQQGPAMYFDGLLKNVIPVDLEIKYTRIDPNYVAGASAVNDTTSRTINAAGTGVIMNWNSYAGDPTLLYNNTSRMDARATITLPSAFGFLNLNYGAASQVTGTTDTIMADHYIFGNRLTGAMWWQLFFGQYGYPVSGRDNGFFSYNAIDHPEITNQGTGHRYIFLDKWLTNLEMIKSKDPTNNDKYNLDTSIKYSTNVSAELKLSIHKMLSAMGIQTNNIFLEIYGELNTLRPGDDMMPTFDPSTLFSESLADSFIVWNMTRKTNIMFEYACDRWATRNSWVAYQTDSSKSSGYDYVNIPVDYIDQNFSIGFDYDFAPRTSLFLRAKRFMHKDLVLSNNFRLPDGTIAKDQSFDGWYLGFELKNFF
jgi:hypothetical protein